MPTMADERAQVSWPGSRIRHGDKRRQPQGQKQNGDAPGGDSELAARKARHFVQNDTQANRGMQAHRKHEGAVKEKPEDRSLGAAQNLLGGQSALDGVNHHRDVAQGQWRHDQRGDPLQHVKAQVKHGYERLRRKDFAVSRFKPAIADIGSRSLGQNAVQLPIEWQW